jgi:regulator of protease activity HflC (stomatin/prohibitin superfamily)
MVSITVSKPQQGECIMSESRFTTLRNIALAVRNTFKPAASTLQKGVLSSASRLNASRRILITTGLVVAGAYWLWTQHPLQTIEQGDVGIRINRLTGSVSQHPEGPVWIMPSLHQLRQYTLRDQIYYPTQAEGKEDNAPFQSVEGLSFGVEMSVRYALNPDRVATIAQKLPEDIGGQVVQPAVQGVIHKVFTRYTVREIFSSKRAEIQKTIEDELLPKLAADGIMLRNVQLGKINLPEDYRRGMDKLLAEELATAKMRYTLELKEKRIKETELDAEAEKVRREKNAQAAASEQLIAAKAQEEAMKHVLPFKQKQIEQRQLEAEAEKQSRIRAAEANAQSRKIEAVGEAESRQKLADAEVYRLERVGKVTTDQMERDGALITKHPLLIQKALADKLSDKITVIVAPPGTHGNFLGAGLLGGGQNAAHAPQSEMINVKEGE